MAPIKNQSPSLESFGVGLCSVYQPSFSCGHFKDGTLICCHGGFKKKDQNTMSLCGLHSGLIRHNNKKDKLALVKAQH